MSSRAATSQIVSMYESLEMSVEQICADIGELDEVTIKTILLNNSPLYRKRQEKNIMALTNGNGNGNGSSNSDLITNPGPKIENDSDDITQDEFKIFLQAYKELALNTENDSVRERSLRYLIDEKKGRNNLPTMFGNGDAAKNIHALNSMIFAARNAVIKEKVGRASCRERV